MADRSRTKKWLPLEANPAVMHEFVRNLGFPSTAGFYDVYGFDEELLAMVPQPVLGVLLLFPEDSKAEAAKAAEVERLQKQGQHVSDNVYFMLQTVGNACGTIGLLHAIGNNTSTLQLKGDSWLQKFFQETSSMSPSERAKHLEEDTQLEEAHSAAAVVGDTAAPDINEAVNFHFVAFVCVDGSLYELDGSRPFPVNHGPSTPDSLLQDSVKVIRGYMERNPDAIQFNVIAMSNTAEG
eukprot:jgi/Mesen1/563/ME000105S10737